jgi:hypothetical protein
LLWCWTRPHLAGALQGERQPDLKRKEAMNRLRAVQLSLGCKGQQHLQHADLRPRRCRSVVSLHNAVLCFAAQVPCGL